MMSEPLKRVIELQRLYNAERDQDGIRLGGRIYGRKDIAHALSQAIDFDALRWKRNRFLLYRSLLLLNREQHLYPSDR
jgi:hypothetical protein